MEIVIKNSFNLVYFETCLREAKKNHNEKCLMNNYFYALNFRKKTR